MLFEKIASRITVLQWGRLDQEMSLAVNASIEANRETIVFPLPDETEVERNIHRGFEERFNCAWDDVETLVDVFYPRS